MSVGIYFIIQCGCWCSYFMKTKELIGLNCCERHEGFKDEKLTKIQVLNKIIKDNYGRLNDKTTNRD